MSDDLERLLAQALDARARAAVPDSAAPPAPRFAEPPPDVDVSTGPGWVGANGRRRSLTRVLAPVLAAAAVVAAVAVSVVVAHQGGHSQPVSGRPAVTPARRTAPRAETGARPVHISLLNAAGARYGVGMPVIAHFSRRITSGVALQDATTVTVNGTPAAGAWFFETSSADKGGVEGHFRLADYWPAHSSVHVSIPAKGLSAGPGLGFADGVTLDFTTGARTVSVVDDSTHELTVTRDGSMLGRFRVSLGAAATPTERGTKVIMAKGASICMSGPGYSECGVEFTQRLTYAGEYLHAAPWNTANIHRGVDSSNGCTNLRPPDAARLYRILEVGDVVSYPNANGPAMQLGDGYGDWNVAWATWLTGGLIPT